MKKMIPFILICIMMTSHPVESKNKGLQFVIYFDSNETNLIQRKNEIIALMNDTMDYLSDASVTVMLQQDIDELQSEERKVIYKKSTLYFFLGDYHGAKIEGSLLRNSFCIVEVKPKSFIRKWFNF